MHGDRTFTEVARTLWDSFPVNITNSDSCNNFERKLKTFLLLQHTVDNNETIYVNGLNIILCLFLRVYVVYMNAHFICHLTILIRPHVSLCAITINLMVLCVIYYLHYLLHIYTF